MELLPKYCSDDWGLFSVESMKDWDPEFAAQHWTTVRPINTWVKTMRTSSNFWGHVRGAVLLASISLGALGWALPASAGVEDIECGSLENAFGPFDYRTASEFNKRLVEKPHFIDQNSAIMRGQLRARDNHVMDDLHYTLRVFPNHHGALMAIDRVGRLTRSERPLSKAYKLECYYLRGIRMASDDAMVYYLYGMYLQHRGHKAEARQKVDRSVELFEEKEDGMSPNVLYNLGLAFFEFGEYDQAANYARRAAERGFILPGLRKKLQRVGRWQEAQPEANAQPQQSPNPAGDEFAAPSANAKTPETVPRVDE